MYRTKTFHFLARIVVTCLASAVAASSYAAKAEIPPLAIEEIGRIENLPASYPEDWVLIDESSFFNMYGGKIIILDVTEKDHPKRMKGMLSKSMLGNFTQSAKRGEYYIIESFHERGSRGKKFDVLVTYDKQTLNVDKLSNQI